MGDETIPILHDPFAAGDFLAAARSESRESWQYWAAMALVAGAPDALAELERRTEGEAPFYAGVAAWMAGDDERALAHLDRVGSPHARRLAVLIRRRPISVCAQLPSNRSGPWALLTALNDPAFRLFNVSFHQEDIPNRPYADVLTLIPPDVSPDFYVAAMLEWHLIPQNIRELGCPVIGASSDFDLHIQAVAPWLPQFDEIVVLDSEEWRLMRGLVDAPVSVFPKMFGLPDAAPPLREVERSIDIFVSGTLLHPFHYDKDVIIRDLLNVPDTRIRMVNGFESEEHYFANLSASKTCCTFVRHPGAMPTRGLEALAMGCVVAVQEESALRLFVGDDGGTVAYDARHGGASKRIAHVLANWEEYARKARRGAAIVREHFALSRVASEFLRFLTVLAARPRHPRDPATRDLIQKRTVVHKGWLPSYRFGGDLLMGWAASSVARLDAQIADRPTVRNLIDRSRETLLANYHDAAVVDPLWLPEAMRPLERAILAFPDALVPRLNLIRVGLHFGGPENVARALERLDDALARDDGSWQLDPLDDVLPWDFCPSYFDYRSYFDAVTAILGGETTRAVDLAPLILASLHHYRALYPEGQDAASRIEHAAAAVRLAPAFVPFRLFHSRLLIERGREYDLAAAAESLRSIAAESVRLVEVADLARALPSALRHAWAMDVDGLAERFWDAIELREHLAEPPLRPLRAGTAGRLPPTFTI